MAEYKLLVEGPTWWRDKVIRQEVAKVEYANLRAYPWNPSFENGNRLKSLWVRVVGFPTKLWSKREFERLMEGFGTILEIDQRTIDRSYLVEANIRIGVCRFEDVPLTRQVVFRNDRGEKCWTDVRFLFEFPVNHNKQQRNKRQRVWVPKDQSPSNSAPPGTDTQNHKDQNTSNEEDLLEEEADSSQRLSDEAYDDMELTVNIELQGQCENVVETGPCVTGSETQHVQVGDKGITQNNFDSKSDRDNEQSHKLTLKPFEEVPVLLSPEPTEVSGISQQGNSEQNLVVTIQPDQAAVIEVQPLARMPPATRQSLRLHLKNPENSILAKAMSQKYRSR